MVLSHENTSKKLEFPFNLRDEYSITVLMSKKVEKSGVQEQEENPHTAFILDIVKEVGKLPLKNRRVFGKKLALVGALMLPFSASSVLNSKKAGAEGLDQLIPYIQQRNHMKENPQYWEQIQQQQQVNGQYPVSGPTSGEMIPVDGSLTDKLVELGILPREMVNLLLDIIVACGILGVLLAAICLMVAGGFRMMGQLERAKKWSVDVIKGLGQILLAPVVIIILALITTNTLNGIEGLDLFY